jgi:3-deoxy-manno-octulosonate cytidylyltransferase (CMP-KDO synthetase)
MKKKIIGLIPTRLNSSRLPNKALLEIQDIPLIIHTYKRAKLSKKIDDVYICCDDEKIYNVAKKYKAKCIITSRHHANGTERIGEAYKSLNQKYDLIVDIQGDEPLISPIHIDQVIAEHIKNYDHADIILPTLLSSQKNNTNIVKVVCDKKNYVLYLSRSNIPFEFKKNEKKFRKHLSIISFKPNALEIFCKSEKTTLESIEDIELLRALELGLKIKTINLKGDSFSVDVKEDYIKASKFILSDKYLKLYKI